MKDINGKILFNNQEYKIVFNLNVMEEIQNEYGTIDKWGSLTDGTNGEPDAKAVIFGFRAMINEGIEIDNEENGTDRKPLTSKQVGRLITSVGLREATTVLNNTVIASSQSAEKNS